MAEHYSSSPQVVDPVCDTCVLETTISRIGEIEEVPVYVPRYAACLTSIVATGNEGNVSGEMWYPSGVAIHEDTHKIFVANFLNCRVEIFSETGEFLYQLGVGRLSKAWGIATRGDSLYVSCEDDHTASKFSLTEMCRIRRIGGRGSNNGQFLSLSQLTTDPIGRVFVADTLNHRIFIHDPDLNHLRNNTRVSQPFDVEISGDLLYVLCCVERPYILVFTPESDEFLSVCLFVGH